MNKNLHDIDKLFQDTIEPLQESPGNEVWENIERQLDKKDTEKYKRKFVVLRRVATILLLLLIGIVTFTVITFNSIKDRNKKSEGNNYASSQNGNNVVGLPDSPGQINTSTRNRKKIAIEKKSLLINLPSKKTITREKRSVFEDDKNSTKIKESAGPDKKDNKHNQQKGFVNEIPKTGISNVGKIAIVNVQPLSRIEAPKLFPLNTKFSESPFVQIAKQAIKKNPPGKSFHPLFSISAFLAPEYAGYNLLDDETNPYDNKQEIEQRENHMLSSSAGIFIGYHINSRITIQSGISYSRTNISIDPTEIFAVRDNAGDVKYRYNTSSGYGFLLPTFSASINVGDSLYAKTANHKLQYINIPLLFKYKFAYKKISFDPGIGVSFNFVTKAILTTEVENSLNHESETISRLEGLRKINIGLLFIPELQYQLSDKWALTLMPYFKYSLNSINKYNVVRTYPYNIGIGIGAVYKLRF